MSSIAKPKKLTSSEISTFCKQMSLLLKAGITPMDGIDILEKDTKDSSGKEILKSLSQVLHSGETFHVALEMSGVFPDYVIHMAAIGEESGNMDTVMESLSDYYDREENIESSIKSAVSYPLIMVFMMLIVVLVLVTKVLPIFQQVFTQLGTTMSGFAQSLLNLGNALNRYSVVLVVLLVVAAVLFLYFFAAPNGKENFKKLMQKLSMTKRLMLDIETERFANGMVLTLSSGMDTFEGLSLVQKLASSDTMKEKIENCRNLILDGDSFPEAIDKSGIFNSFYSRMIMVGFQSGSMDQSMKQVSERIEKDTEKRIYSLISVIEPTLVIILSLIVGMVLLSVILPLMGIMSTIG
ncbi:MAG: type II secretion system F family protein [Butyrivibrio sp.]|nr:type II secretion system F family protein [Butyrivibrio sp.]